MAKSARINVLFLIHGLAIGGAEKMLINIVNSLDQKLFKPVVVTLNSHNPLYNEIKSCSVKVFFFPRRWKYDIKPASQLKSIICENHIKKIVCFDLYEFFFAKLALLRQANAPNIYLSVHSTHTSRKKHLQNWIYARFLKGDEKIITVCNAQADYWSKNYHICRKGFNTIYNGVDVDYFKPSNSIINRQRIRKQYKIPNDAFVFIMVSNLHPHKLHEDAFRALKICKDKCLNVVPYILVVGGGFPERQKYLERLARNLDVKKNIIFCGIQKDVRVFYETANAFTLTSKDTFSVSALEAMSMGLPVVIADMSGAREMLENGNNGYLVPCKNPKEIAEGWLKMIRNYKNFDRIAIRKRIIEKFNIKKCTKKYEQILMKNG